MRTNEIGVQILLNPDGGIKGIRIISNSSTGEKIARDFLKKHSLTDSLSEGQKDEQWEAVQ